MPTPEISILMTVFNRQSYLQPAAESVLRSTFTDFELIIVDDCSSDASPTIAAALASSDSRIRFFQNEKNLGDYGNRARAASLARGRFLKYVDSDDLIYPHTLDVMYTGISSFPGAALALSHSASEDEQPYPWCLTGLDAYRKHFLGRGCLACGPTGAIIARHAFENIGGFRKEWGVLSDIDLWLRLAAHGSVVLLPPGLVWWRKHEGQEFRSGTAEWSYLTNGIRLTCETLQAASCPLPETEQRSALSRAKQHHARRLLSLAVRNRCPARAWAAYQQSQLTLLQLLKGLLPYQ
jgi:glycosyltransferase involved in cell wall biosynthesis